MSNSSRIRLVCVFFAVMLAFGWGHIAPAGVAAAEAAAGDEAGQVPVRFPLASRQDVGLAYLRLESAYVRHRPEGLAERQSINREADVAVRHFFGLQPNRALAVLNRLATEIESDAQPDRESSADDVSWLYALRVVLDRPVFFHAEGGVTVDLEQLYDTARPEQLELEIVAAPARRPSHIRSQRMAPDTPLISLAHLKTRAGERAWQVRIPQAVVGGLPAGSYEIGLRPADPGASGPAVVRGRFYRTDRSLGQLAGELRGRLEAMPLPGDEAGLRNRTAVAARIDLLSDRPGSSQTTRFQTDMLRLADQLQAEVAALGEGRAPFAGRSSDYWRTVGSEASAMGAWVYVPAELADARARLRPLVVAFHGAGGDEGMFLFAHGGGRLIDLADRHGFVIASVETPAMLREPNLLLDLVAAMAADHRVDPQRILLIGHSMGGFAISRLVRQLPEHIAAAVMVAGMQPLGRLEPESAPPMKLVIAADDAIVPLRRLEPTGRQARAAGLPLTIDIRPGMGHLLIVAEVLDDAIAWLLEQPAKAGSDDEADAAKPVHDR